jgi:hypothetical protein
VPAAFFGINNVSNPTPARFMIPQDMSVSFKRQVKSLFGENQLAWDVGSGELSLHRQSHDGRHQCAHPG